MCWTKIFSFSSTIVIQFVVYVQTYTHIHIKIETVPHSQNYFLNVTSFYSIRVYNGKITSAGDIFHRTYKFYLSLNSHTRTYIILCTYMCVYVTYTACIYGMYMNKNYSFPLIFFFVLFLYCVYVNKNLSCLVHIAA